MKLTWPPLRTLFATAFALIAAVLITQIPLDFVESYLFDLRMVLRPAPPLTNQIQLVLMDQKSISSLGHSPTFEDHARLLEKIAGENPKAIVYVTELSKVSGSPKEKQMFADVANGIPNFYHVVDSIEAKEEIEKLNLAPPLNKIQVKSGPKTADAKILAKDGVTRRMMISYQGQVMLHPFLALQFGRDLPPSLENSKLFAGQINLYDSQQAYINFHKPGSFPTVKFEMALGETFAPLGFKDKIVFVGDDLQLSHDDYIYTPYSRDRNFVTRTEMHANMLETLLGDSAPTPVHKNLNFLIVVLISILTVHVVLNLKPLKGLLILGGTALGFSLFSFLAFWPFGYWLDMSHAYLSIFLCYYFLIPYRLIVENRRSWEYYQKHKILSEVELLKTNFIGMMSHDLKTPLARIYGMTEIISKDPVPLSSPQREALDVIQQSAHDLTQFISTILNYAKIESEGLELRRQSKDPNPLILEAVRQHEFLAKLKHIQLVTELEPLFPISIDPDVIKQVISNLIENAIKYSPENSKVLISSEEKDGRVLIQVADQGIGIPAEDIGHVFMKFFRSQNAKASPIKGSGLGLYLAKYFVELHSGSLFVESSPGQGSTFTVDLPLK